MPAPAGAISPPVRPARRSPALRGTSAGGKGGWQICCRAASWLPPQVAALFRGRSPGHVSYSGCTSLGFWVRQVPVSSLSRENWFPSAQCGGDPADEAEPRSPRCRRGDSRGVTSLTPERCHRRAHDLHEAPLSSYLQRDEDPDAQRSAAPGASRSGRRETPAGYSVVCSRCSSRLWPARLERRAPLHGRPPAGLEPADVQRRLFAFKRCTDHRVLVTNLDLTPGAVYRFYCDRGVRQLLLREFKDAYSLAKIPPGASRPMPPA